MAFLKQRPPRVRRNVAASDPSVTNRQVAIHNLIIRFCKTRWSHHSQQAVRASTRTMKKSNYALWTSPTSRTKPGASLMSSPAVRPRTRWVPHWGSKNLDALLFEGDSWHTVAVGFELLRFQHTTHVKPHSNLVPDLCLTRVNTDARMDSQLLLQNGAPSSHPV